MLRIVIWQIDFEDGTKVKIHSEIEPPLKPIITMMVMLTKMNSYIWFITKVKF